MKRAWSPVALLRAATIQANEEVLLWKASFRGYRYSPVVGGFCNDRSLLFFCGSEITELQMADYLRTLEIETRKSSAGVYPVTLSTEIPYLRHFGYEVLDHNPESIDLSRAPIPVLDSHNGNQLNIGIVEDLHVEGRKLRGNLRLGERAKDIAKDVDDGIVRNVSVGYRVNGMTEEGEAEDGEPVYRVDNWELLELSLVSVPADPTAGIYRSENIMNDLVNNVENNEPLSRSQRRAIERDSKDERDRVDSIRHISDKQSHVVGVKDLAEKAISRGDSVETFRDGLFLKMDEQNQRGPGAISGAPAVHTKQHEYSVVSLIRKMALPGERHDLGLEMEMHQELERKMGKRSNGFFIPISALQTRAVTAGGSGANMIGTDHMDSEFIDILRPRSQIMRLNPKVLTGLVGDVNIPRKSGSATGYWVGGDDSDSITGSDVTLDQVSLSPNSVGGLVTFSHKMIIQSAPGIEQIVREDLAALMGQELDAKAIAGTGANNQPTGVLNTSGITGVTYTNGGAPGFADIVGMETALADDNADDGSLSYLTTPSLAGGLKTADVGTDTGQFVWAAGKERGMGNMNGLPALTSKNMSAGHCVLANWSDLLIGQWGAVEISADAGGANFAKGSVSVRALMDCDVAVRHPESFVVLSEAP